LSYSMSDVASDSVAVYIGVPLANPLYAPASDPVGESGCVTVGSITYCYPSPSAAAASPSPSPSQGVTVTSVVNDIVYAISVIFDSIAQAIAELAPYLISFLAAFSVMGRTYNAVRSVILRFFGRYFRI